MSRKWFRFLLLLGWVICLGGLIVSYVEEPSLPPALREYLDSDVNEPLTSWDFVVFFLLLSLLIVGVVNTVGLYRFKPWARKLTLWGFVAGYAVTPILFREPAVITPLAETFFTLGNALSGFILALIYFSPVARHFESGPPKFEEVLKHGRSES
jgi:hypothetical protein